MHVVATAGHVDHGKSTLVRALTGRDPDRLAEEHRRGLTIELGYAWTTLPSGRRLALVDVPGHQRFVPTMLAGVGAVPAVLFVVAADAGWQPQSAEHLQALSAYGVGHGLLVVTRCDLADPEPTAAQALSAMSATSLAGLPWLAVSARTGSGLASLRQALDELCASLPVPDPTADVRLWVDRSFVVRGAGTVVTGTLPAGTIAVGDDLEFLPGRRPLRVRGIQSMEQQVDRVTGAARVALNLRGVDVADVPRGTALVTPGAFVETCRLDVRLHRTVDDPLPSELVLHQGSTHRSVHLRPLGTDNARLTIADAVPVHLGDRLVLRDAGAHQVPAGATVLAVDPPGLSRRGAPRARAAELAGRSLAPDAAAEIERRGVVAADVLRALGLQPAGAPTIGSWHLADGHVVELRKHCAAALSTYSRDHPLAAGMPADALVRTLGLPDAQLLPLVLPEGAQLADGRVATCVGLPAAVQAGLAELTVRWAENPWQAPDSDQLAALGLGRRELAAAARIGALLEVAAGVCIAPGAVTAAVERLATLPQPFSVSDARRALSTSRRVAVPLLELLDRQGATQRLPDDRRTTG